MIKTKSDELQIAEKLELIRWLMDLEIRRAISYLKVRQRINGVTTDWGIHF